ncbi:MAG TPA: T9SS type A sorting domain-containing protein, partial [Saprospiraceae bacterium]|nr:T9SS type A sorting domain-containing protein [Saprospiraceae bacterium]
IVVTKLGILDAGNAGSDFLWNTGDTTQTLFVETPGLYQVIVTDSSGCTASDVIYVEIITEVIELSNSKYLQIYPNPTKGVFTISGDLHDPDQLSLKITNSLGQIVYNSPQQNIEAKFAKVIDLKGIGNGIYYLQISLGEHMYVGKVMLE